MKLPFWALLIPLAGGGCGTVVPNAVDWSSDHTDTLDTALLVENITLSVQCELQNAVASIVATEARAAAMRANHRNYVEFLEEWGAEVSLTLTIAENTNLNPTALLAPPSAPSSLFTVSGGLTLSNKATRLEKINLFYTVKELNRIGCAKSHSMKSPLIYNDLKIAGILESRILLSVLGRARDPGDGPKLVGKNHGLTHQVTFQVVSSGNVTPTWKLVHATINPTGSLLNTGRDRTHDLVVTFGPLDGKAGGRSLIPSAEQSHYIAQLSSGLATSISGLASRQ
ncbi:hypothetical protein J2X48_001416 [Bosea sp. BE271]|uniref:hypothetical protein n=1 Tax=Bosea TaxID=85413 RepID=UPI002857B13E|nr:MULTISPECIES: hypothetical protein [Bosea]MDR6827690.1 hypothetical protein [Bosea robiniae]MDR6894616.1 hypothetical protein [Bosea sp. BE109]MDR7137796.1 hypothetical protein [Bosea sp. BE168]MDR7174495.1 hypothetical protein [Bosea sp. BE271]